MKSSLKLFAQPLLVVLAFMLLYALVHAMLGFYVKKDSAQTSPNAEKPKQSAKTARFHLNKKKLTRTQPPQKKTPPKTLLCL